MVEHEAMGGPEDDGWTDLLPSAGVPGGTVVSVDIDDLELVVWRDLGGGACVMDARCPHQWSHLGAEGVVDGDEVVCTAHFWRFDRQGTGSKVTVRGRRDPKAGITVHPSREIDGRLQIRRGGAGPEPTGA